MRRFLFGFLLLVAILIFSVLIGLVVDQDGPIANLYQSQFVKYVQSEQEVFTRNVNELEREVDVFMGSDALQNVYSANQNGPIPQSTLQQLSLVESLEGLQLLQLSDTNGRIIYASEASKVGAEEVVPAVLQDLRRHFSQSSDLYYLFPDMDTVLVAYPVVTRLVHKHVGFAFLYFDKQRLLKNLGSAHYYLSTFKNRNDMLTPVLVLSEEAIQPGDVARLVLNAEDFPTTNAVDLGAGVVNVPGFGQVFYQQSQNPDLPMVVWFFLFAGIALLGFSILVLFVQRQESARPSVFQPTENIYDLLRDLGESVHPPAAVKKNAWIPAVADGPKDTDGVHYFANAQEEQVAHHFEEALDHMYGEISQETLTETASVSEDPDTVTLEEPLEPTEFAERELATDVMALPGLSSVDPEYVPPETLTEAVSVSEESAAQETDTVTIPELDTVILPFMMDDASEELSLESMLNLSTEEESPEPALDLEPLDDLPILVSTFHSDGFVAEEAASVEDEAYSVKDMFAQELDVHLFPVHEPPKPSTASTLVDVPQAYAWNEDIQSMLRHHPNVNTIAVASKQGDRFIVQDSAAFEKPLVFYENEPVMTQFLLKGQGVHITGDVSASQFMRSHFSDTDLAEFGEIFLTPVSGEEGVKGLHVFTSKKDENPFSAQDLEAFQGAQIGED